MKQIKLPMPYSQWDSKWAKDILGYNSPNSGFDLYNYGCLITCGAMVLEYYGKKETPRDINEDLKDANGYASDSGNYIWGSMRRIFSQIQEEEHIVTPYPLSDDQIGQIKGALDQGFPVMIQIDVNPKTVQNDMHFVLIIGYNPDEENDFTILDPLGGVERSLKHYLGWFRPSARKTIENYTIFRGKVPNELSLADTKIDFDDMEGKRRTVGWYVDAWYDQKADKAEQKRVFEQKLKDKDEAFLKTANLLTESSKEVQRKEGKIQELSGQITVLKAEISRLTDQNSSLFEIGDLIKLLIKKLTPFSK